MRNLFQMLTGLFLLFLLQECASKPAYYNPEEFYSLTDTLRSERFPEPIFSKGSVGTYHTPYGVLIAINGEQDLFQLLDSTNAKRITAAGRRGRGPNELLMERDMQYDAATNRFSVFDMYQQEMITYRVAPDTIAFEKRVKLNKDLIYVQYINDSLLVYMNFYPNQKIGLMNARAEELFEQEYNPLHDDRVKTTHRYHQVDLAVSPDKQHTVVIEKRFPSIQCYKNHPDKLELVWDKMLFAPNYSIRSENNWYVRSDDSYEGFRCLFLTDKYIYATCDPSKNIDSKLQKPVPQYTYLLVMDYRGNLVKKYLLDREFYSFALSPDEKSLYTVIYNPDVLLAKYAL